MNENAIAIILYISFLLMAGIVLVLTYIYFIGKTSSKTRNAITSDSKQSREKKLLKILPGEVQTEKIIMPLIDNNKTEDSNERIGSNLEVKPNAKETTPAKILIEPLPTDNKIMPNNVSDVKSKPQLDNYVISQPIDSKNETKEQLILKETPMVEVLVAQQNSQQTEHNVINLHFATNPLDSNGKDGNKHNVKIESEKRELKHEMDINNQKLPANSEVEKTRITSVNNNPSAPLTNTPGGIKSPEPNTSLNDLSKMFSREVAEDSEASKLAKDMENIDTYSLLKCGQELTELFKQNRRQEP
jgi:hypothetical protein